jgi:hypothetical protein
MTNSENAPEQTQKNIYLWESLPYLFVLLLAIIGVAYTNITQQHLVGYWEFLAVAIGIVCIVTQWPALEDTQARKRLIWTQALHWVTFLITMNIVLLPNVRNMLPAPAISLVLLMLVALGTFLAGVNLLSLPISFLGLAMALAVPAIAWLKQSALFFFLAAVLCIGLGVAFWGRGSRESARPDTHTDSSPGLS